MRRHHEDLPGEGVAPEVAVATAEAVQLVELWQPGMKGLQIMGTTRTPVQEGLRALERLRAQATRAAQLRMTMAGDWHGPRFSQRCLLSHERQRTGLVLRKVEAFGKALRVLQVALVSPCCTPVTACTCPTTATVLSLHV